jgi:SAM-dependent methyltransferase
VREVVAYDLAGEMLAVVRRAARERGLTKVNNRQGVVESLPFAGASFDFVFSRYSAHHWRDLSAGLHEAARVLKPGGILSVVKHNRAGRVFKSAVFDNDPKKALVLLDVNANDKNNYLGTQYICSNDYIEKLVDKYDCTVKKILGMRTFFALGQDNAVKYSDDWYENMLTVEKAVASVDEYRSVAFHNHLLIEKAR